jgi:succinyl-CoA synthetase beta subunit
VSKPFLSIFLAACFDSMSLVYSSSSPLGIMRCDYIAEGVIKATKELQLDVPLIVRLQGTKEAEAKQCVTLTSRV